MTTIAKPPQRLCTTCPTCRQPVPLAEIVIDRETRTVVHGGASAELTHQQLALFDHLVAARPAAARRADVCAELYPDMQEGTALRRKRKQLDVIACHLRAKIAPLGLLVAPVWGIGWRLEEGRPEDLDMVREIGVRMRSVAASVSPEETRPLSVIEAAASGLGFLAAQMRLRAGPVARARAALLTGTSRVVTGKDAA